ncbi:MAG TPA: cytochrome b/b6 domain-containing protein [Pyrinomonadaceae bacterium]|nr:cytochrome b/b6 domain-containing protein [Pyrinomonadaceae bacterium]
MRSYVLVAVLSVLLLGWSMGWCSSPLLKPERVLAQTQTETSPAAAATTNRQPKAAGETAPAISPALQCQACHGPGKKLPYLGGALFHTDPHKAYEQGFHAQAITGGRNGGKAATCLDCHAKNGDLSTVLPADDPQSPINRVNIAATCGKCHGNKAVMQGSGISNRPFLSYQESVHAQALARGNTSAAVCTDCHNSHDIRPASDQQSSIFKINIPRTCGQCHRMEANEFVASVHGVAVSRGVSRAPVCTDCHGIHNIKAPFDPATAAVVATDSCAQCHEGVTLTQEFGVASGRVASYKDSYHGLASRLGSKIVANCASCHGVHNILPSSDPKSMINAHNLPQTCGQCHVGASANFTRGRIHLTEPAVSEVVASRDLGLVGTRIVRWIYLPAIFIIIGGMLVHNGLIWRSKAVAKRRLESRTLVRLTKNQRLQHWLLLSSFIVLVFSGFALQYPDSWLAWLLGSSEYLRRVIHRVAAVVMLGAGVYHLGYLAFTSEGKQWLRDILPRLKDVRDVVQNLGYYSGANSNKPKIARFGYAEKAEYWAVLWGTVIMGLTGLMIWFKLGFFSFLSRGWIEIALAIHFYEAVLATLAIIVWHFYHVIFDPDVYPINWAFLDGRISEELYKEEHELDYERLEQSKLGEKEKGTDEGSGGATVPTPGD